LSSFSDFIDWCYPQRADWSCVAFCIVVSTCLRVLDVWNLLFRALSLSLSLCMDGVIALSDNKETTGLQIMFSPSFVTHISLSLVTSASLSLLYFPHLLYFCSCLSFRSPLYRFNVLSLTDTLSFSSCSLYILSTTCWFPIYDARLLLFFKCRWIRGSL
jgi:hypothetical protein